MKSMKWKEIVYKNFQPTPSFRFSHSFTMSISCSGLSVGKEASLGPKAQTVISLGEMGRCQAVIFLPSALVNPMLNIYLTSDIKQACALKPHEHQFDTFRFVS